MSPQLRERIDWRTSYQITLAGLAATRLFSAGGAGGIALTYWALRRAGMEARQAASRMVAFLVLLYTVYLLALVICGIFLRVGLFPGPSPVGMTIVPAGLAGAALIILFLLSLIPVDLDRIVARWAQGHRRVRMARRIASVPATVAAGTREALLVLRHPSSGLLALVGAVGFWATNIAVLWACFHAFGEDVPKAVLVQGFFVGMTANLLPFFPGGVGSVDAGHDRRLPGLRRAELDGVRVGARLPGDRLLAADTARNLRLPPAAADGCPLARGGLRSPNGPPERPQPGRRLS